ncbi:hypothetical protein K1I94_02780 [Streptococcus sanguinis]|uniref:HEPN domain-containing protein n=1 Tax=Streptococcus sanguinis TaxID=1305 RepID=UPI001CBFEED9|nr:HEPN domain-containing protein [Streptococcus sanguinis]MBZ2065816.1 hypothetical protein [Streptococcus sanguinis]
MDYKFSYQERIENIENSIASYNQLKQLSTQASGFITISDSLLDNLGSSLVVAIYSLSEQLLKDTIYKLLEVDFKEETQSFKDKFILKQIPPESHPITPDLDRIKSELKIFDSNFKLYLPKITDTYKKAYIKLIKARHDYAHGNIHTEGIEYTDALHFVEYLNIHYSEIIEGKYIKNIQDYGKNLIKLKDHENYQEFTFHKEEIATSLSMCVGQIEELYFSEEKYDIYYLNEIYESLKEAHDMLNDIKEDTFQEDIQKFKEFLDVVI